MQRENWHQKHPKRSANILLGMLWSIEARMFWVVKRLNRKKRKRKKKKKQKCDVRPCLLWCYVFQGHSDITKSKVKQNNMFSSAFEMLNNFKGTSWNVKVHYQQKVRFQVFGHWVNREMFEKSTSLMCQRKILRRLFWGGCHLFSLIKELN